MQAEHDAELARCPTGPRARPDAGADTISILALATGHTAAPGVSGSASAEAVTIAPVGGGAPASAVHASPAASAPGRSRLGVVVGLAAALGVAALVGVGLSRRATEPATGQPSPARAADPASPAEPKPSAPVPDPAPAPPSRADEPVESVVAVPKPRPTGPASTAGTGKPAGGGTNAAAKKPRRRKSPTTPQTPAKPSDSSLPAFKDHVYED